MRCLSSSSTLPPHSPGCRTPSSARSLSSQLSTQLPKADSATPLNTAYFDPDAYLRRMLKDTRLADLTSKHRAMLAEVGSLDSDMQVGGSGWWQWGLVGAWQSCGWLGLRRLPGLWLREVRPRRAVLCPSRGHAVEEAPALSQKMPASGQATWQSLPGMSHMHGAFPPAQMLVYENYNKFVTATDTIKVMNSSMGGMDANMGKLKDLIGR